ncbi:MAG: Crp/Fnr family transcriptional regulator [Paracoccaceae bacterium]|nr:Crp/Fnr family transcriptional regulator [Paracoccaceae bacterium]
MKVTCAECPLRRLPAFRSLTGDDLAVTERLKKGELRVEAGMPILTEGASSPQLFTVLQGQGLRTKMLPDGERQVLGFVFPGDFLGLQAAVMAEMEHSVEAATDMLLCVFDRNDLRRLYRDAPRRAFDVTWLAAMEESLLAEALATVGQLPARARVAWGLLKLLQRAEVSGLATLDDGRAPMPFRQQDLADALGLSVVHTNKMLAALRTDGLATWRDGVLDVHDRAGLAHAAGIPPETKRDRPLI